ncbi:MAG: OmpA family protein [Salinisphaeraceae bacterium]|nr:OmpA family protein [Salinisphaeraceae bacterium]
MKKLLTAATVATAVTLTGCATDDPNKRSKIGAAIGAVVGGVVGHQADGDKGKYVGAVVGAIAGGAVGNYMDKQHAELQKRLAEEAAREELYITELPGNALKIGLASEVSFDTGKHEIKPGAYATYTKIATVLKDFDKTVVHVVGHTDSVGSNEYNQGLSERRASSVGNRLIAEGLPNGRVLLEGRGEREPIADNSTEEGRSRNRRVDIVIKPIVEGRESDAYTPPPYLGS